MPRRAGSVSEDSAADADTAQDTPRSGDGCAVAPAACDADATRWGSRILISTASVSGWAVGSMGTASAPTRRIASRCMTNSAEVGNRIATRLPGPIPTFRKASAHAVTRSYAVPKVNTALPALNAQNSLSR